MRFTCDGEAEMFSHAQIYSLYCSCPFKIECNKKELTSFKATKHSVAQPTPTTVIHGEYKMTHKLSN